MPSKYVSIPWVGSNNKCRREGMNTTRDSCTLRQTKRRHEEILQQARVAWGNLKRTLLSQLLRVKSPPWTKCPEKPEYLRKDALKLGLENSFRQRGTPVSQDHTVFTEERIWPEQWSGVDGAETAPLAGHDLGRSTQRQNLHLQLEVINPPRSDQHQHHKHSSPNAFFTFILPVFCYPLLTV